MKRADQPRFDSNFRFEFRPEGRPIELTCGSQCRHEPLHFSKNLLLLALRRTDLDSALLVPETLMARNNHCVNQNGPPD